MDLLDIRTLARHLHASRVEVVEIEDYAGTVRIQLDLKAQNCDLADVATPPAAADGRACLVRSEALGVFRGVHPSRPSDSPVRPGDVVVRGQALALLQLGDSFRSVYAPEAGTISEVLVVEGQRVDYGMPLFGLRVVVP